MTHDDALSLLSARIDGPLSADQQSDLDAWIAESPDNQVLAEAFQSQHGELYTAFRPRREAARQTAVAVARELANAPSPAPARRSLSWWRMLATPIPAGCATALLLAIGLFSFRGKPGEPRLDEPSMAARAYDRTEGLGLTALPKKQAPKSVAMGVGETIATKPGEKRRVTLPDGSFLYLNQETSVVLTKARHVKLTAGEMFLEAIPAKNAGDQFVVETASKSVTALGTKFAVSATKAGTGVFVTQGKVEVSGLSEKLTTGQELPPGADKVASAPRASAALDWTKDLMIAAESPLVPAGKHSGGSLVAVDPYGQEAKLSLVKFHVDVHIEDGFARTTIDQTYFNSENSRMEGTFYFPLPPDASLSRLAMYVDGDLMEGGMADRGHARDVYETIRYQNRDPALLEWVDGSVFKMRVFPLEARQEKRIVLAYSQRLPVLYGQATYRFPAGHTLALVDKWSFNAVVKNGHRVSVTSPSHPSMKIVPRGSDQAITDEAKNVKVDRDVVLELHDHQAADAANAVRWSSAELDGQKYLMVRYRPELPSAPRRERRDWVVLFESSGARDPLVARAQVEVIRSLLAHAEHDDTFSIVSVGTHVRKWNDTPQAATADNIARAIAWLEARHLIGALNLDQALSDLSPILQAGTNPHLVHVGGGIASIGEQRADELVKRIPAGTKYVGIGVGKRISPAFMKVAAEKTGGLFTQVNPDEPIAWRGFEIASTLNAPRLLNIRVETPGVNTVRFLTFSSSLAHGEELAALANITHAMPSTIVVNGTMDGQPFAKTLPISNVAPQADYLPRTWAKLEIDRMMAQDSVANERSITELSKAMYVMTPFTSLLVLENEQMYKDFKVDRGRKDHWAMYPCPAKIPVVYIPDPNLAAGSRPDLKDQKPHENAVLQTILVRNSPKYLTWPGHDGGDNPIETAGQRFGNAFALPMEEEREELMNEDAGLAGAEIERRLSESDRPLSLDFAAPRLLSEKGAAGLRRSSEMLGAKFYRRGASTGSGSGRQGLRDRNLLRPESNEQVSAAGGDIPAIFDTFMASANGRTRFSGRAIGNDGPMGGTALDLALRATSFGRTVPSDGWMPRGHGLARERDGWQATSVSSNVRAKDALELELRQIKFERDLLLRDTSPFAGTLRAEQTDSSLLAAGDNKGEMLGAIASVTTAPQYYGRPSFNGNLRVFNDPVSYAPGMSSSPADVQAVLEAEAAPRFGNRLGTIDPAARKLIEAARSTEWKSLKTADGTFLHDGQGRYAYVRKLSLGLLERVVCDGTHLWHLYPELGIGAKRVVTRFHRAPLLDLIPDFVPSAEDMAHGTDVKFLDDKTVALVPLRSPNADKQPEAWLESHLVFEGNRLVERRWVLQPGKETLVKEVYSSNLTKIMTGKGKPVDESKREETAATAPNLKPDVSGLVVLPLPLRSREHVYRELGMEPGWDLLDRHNACFEYLPEADVFKLLACEFASNNGHNVARIWNGWFRKENNHRTGFFTLMASANYSPRSYEPFTDKFEKDPSDPLVRYLWQMYDEDLHRLQARFGFGPGNVNGDTFLGRLTSFRRIQSRWQGSFIQNEFWGQRDSERERAIAFAVRNADNVLGWCTLAMVQDRAPNQAAWKDVAKAWPVLAEKSAFRYPALYEEARSLGYAGLNEPAQLKFQDLFRAALQEGVLPPLDSSFRNVLESGKQDAWAKLMRETAALCAKKKARPVIVTLAWQCNQVGDTAMADTLLEQALDKMPADEKPLTAIAAIHFLNSTGRYDRSDLIVRELLADAKLAKSSALWRLASQVADNRRDQIRSIQCLEKALDIEYDQLPQVFDVQPIRADYGRLLGHYEWLADASTSLKVSPPTDLVTRVVKAADRWRHLDSESGDVPNRVATILRKAGGEGATELAWDYATTPLAMKPNESGPWVSLAWSVRQEGNWRLADQCYALAFAAEPTNAQLLWDRAQYLQQQGQVAESRKLMEQLAKSDWQPRFSGLKAQARQAIEGR